MPTRQRPGDLGAEDARRHYERIATEARRQRRSLGLSLEAAGRRGGLSGSQHGRLERHAIKEPTLEQLCRAARAVGLRLAVQVYPDGTHPHDQPQLSLLGRFHLVLAQPILMRREVNIPIPGDLRAWDARISDGKRVASIEAVARLDDLQDLARRIGLKLRDDPGAGAVILLLNRTAHNRRVLAEHRAALRDLFPLDGAAILRELKQGIVPSAGGILML